MITFDEAKEIIRGWIKDHLHCDFDIVSSEEEYDRGEWLVCVSVDRTLTLSIRFKEDNVSDFQLEST